MEKLKALLTKYREQLLYLFFGGVTTVINIAAYALCARAGLPTWLSNAVAWVLAVLGAYVSNRIWVFRSRSRGRALAKEFLSFWRTKQFCSKR